MAYEVVMPYHLHMPSYFLETFTEYPDEAQAIIEHAHEYIEQFKNKKREQLISLLVLEKYFKMTGQL